ncbi:MAG TPA: polysaccharide biosynthesis tyrosine autokinase [Planctomycetota bacterium]|nr:polysaccharide biosynthesis tyrosine autokinase [Planctomycetota bacterium]
MIHNRTAEENRQQLHRSLHLTDYFAILREHKWIALLPFLLILGGSVALTLFSAPVYTSEALIEIDTQAPAQGLVQDLQLIDATAQVETEMEIMRSRLVAERAAARLLERGLSDFLRESNEYRPFEVMLRAIGYGSPRCEVEVRCAPPPPNAPSSETFRFRVDGRLEDGRYRVDTMKVREHRFRTEVDTEVVDVTPGEPFTVFDRTFTFGIEGDPTGREYEITVRTKASLAEWVRGRVVVSQVRRNTGLVELGARAATPRLARETAAALAESYLAAKRAKKIDEAGRAMDFLSDQVEITKKSLDEAEGRLDEFRAAHGVTLLSERTHLLIERIGTLQREKAEIDLSRAEQRRLIERLEQDHLPLDSLLLLAREEDPTMTRLAGQLADLRVERSALAADLTPLHPKARDIDTRIETAQADLRRYALARAKAVAEEMDDRVERVNAFLAGYEQEERELPEKERELARLTREADSLLSIHSFLLEKKHEAAIAKESVFNNVRIVDDPVVPNMRTSPNLLINVLIGLFLAVLASLGTAFFSEYLDRSIKTPEELEEVAGLPLYAALPAFRSIRSRELRRMKSQMVTIEKPHSVLAEGYRSLRANIRFAEFETPVRTFAITSAVLGEGKTTTSLNLAVVMAQAGSRVMVVDADMRRPATHAHLKGSLQPGLTDILKAGKDWREVARRVEGVENLSVIHAGKKPDNPGAILDSPRFTALLQELKENFDYVIFDVPPVLAVADAASFFRQLDGVFLLVQWRRCPADVVLAARDQVKRLGASLRGVIFNGFDARKVHRRGYGRYGYYGYYGYYGRYRGYGYGYGEERSGSKAKTEGEIAPRL